MTARCPSSGSAPRAPHTNPRDGPERRPPGPALCPRDRQPWLPSRARAQPSASLSDTRAHGPGLRGSTRAPACSVSTREPATARPGHESGPEGSLRLSLEGPVLQEGMAASCRQVAGNDAAPTQCAEKAQPPAPPEGLRGPAARRAGRASAPLGSPDLEGRCPQATPAEKQLKFRLSKQD